ncbi:MAG: methyltransferase domain-containing protein [Acidimicrobiia bacterium]|nr:methyltransferase domain-containing protein [Acidimicrobiia bacterium]
MKTSPVPWPEPMAHRFSNRKHSDSSVLMSLIEAWDRQQELYIGGREARFDALLSTVEWHSELAGTKSPTVVDLCCGPAAIGERLARRLPGSRYIGVDIDPVLLELARQVTASFAPGRADLVDSDVADPAWLASTPIGRVDVVCSSTGLGMTPNRV